MSGGSWHMTFHSTIKYTETITYCTLRGENPFDDLKWPGVCKAHMSQNSDINTKYKIESPLYQEVVNCTSDCFSNWLGYQFLAVFINSCGTLEGRSQTHHYKEATNVQPSLCLNMQASKRNCQCHWRQFHQISGGTRD